MTNNSLNLKTFINWLHFCKCINANKEIKRILGVLGPIWAAPPAQKMPTTRGVPSQSHQNPIRTISRTIRTISARENHQPGRAGCVWQTRRWGDGVVDCVSFELQMAAQIDDETARRTVCAFWLRLPLARRIVMRVYYIRVYVEGSPLRAQRAEF